MTTQYRPHKIGQDAEQCACDYLQQQGLKLVTKNFRCKLGEIDLVMHDANVLTFIEVRCRNNTDFGSGAETINYKKRTKIIKTAQHYLQKYNLLEKTACRFDVVSIEAHQQLKIEWIKNAFQT